MRTSMRLIGAALLATAWHLSIVPGVRAQAPVPGAGTSEPSPNISEQKLDAAAAALERVTNVHQDYKQRLTEAAPSDRKRIADEGIDAIEKAITDQGLSVEEYSSIIRVAQNDPDIRGKLLQRVRPQVQ